MAFGSNGGSLSVEGEYRVLAGVRHFINDTTFKASKFDLHGQFDADETSKNKLYTYNYISEC